ncbi:hypothetical protein [Nucisporomicrobium flavum]|uniref:hypothetical protein n=1 Tax=Nucisporomicrobium flavum TaxID=2785915 RepID=UPI0018F44B94|nr:hypothetical protein [Nucisporomicrobium flavum]
MSSYLATPNASCRLNGQSEVPCAYFDGGDGTWRIIIRRSDEVPLPTPVRVEVHFEDGSRWLGDAEYGRITNNFGPIEHELKGSTPLVAAGNDAS